MHDRITQELWDFTRAHVFSSVKLKEDREDLVHDILILYLVLADEYKVEPKEFLLIAKQAARNRVRDWARRLKVRNSGKSAPCLEERAGFVDLSQIDARLLLDELQEKLSDRSRLVVEALREGLEPAEIMGLAGMAKSTFYRTLDEIRDELPSRLY